MKKVCVLLTFLLVMKGFAGQLKVPGTLIWKNKETFQSPVLQVALMIPYFQNDLRPVPSLLLTFLKI